VHIVGVTGQSRAGKDVVAARLVEKHGYVQLALADPIKRFGLNVFGFDVIQLWGAGKNLFDPMFTECNIRATGATFEPGSNPAMVKQHCSIGWAGAAVRLAEEGPEFVLELVTPEEEEEALEKLFFWFASLGHHYPELSPRICLQHLGTEWGREAISPDIWIDKLLEDAGYALSGCTYARETGLSHAVKLVDPPIGVVVSDVRFTNELAKIREVGGKIIKVARKSTDKKAKTLGIAGHASEAEQAGFTEDMFDCLLTNDKSIQDLNSAVDVVASAYKNLK
jgi:hypothetical protein